MSTAQARTCPQALGVLALALLCACQAPGRGKQARADSARAPAPPLEAYACTLIGIPELDSIIGDQLHAGPRSEDYQGYSRCDWTRGGTAYLALVVNEHGDFGTYRKVPGAVPVPGLGRGAVWNRATQQLGVQTDRGTLSVNFLTAPLERQTAERIARAVLPRLQRGHSAAPSATVP